MAGRIAGWDELYKGIVSPTGDARRGSGNTESLSEGKPRARVIYPRRRAECIVDEAVERVIGDLNISPAEAEVLRTLVVNDVSGPVSTTFHQSRLAQCRSETNVVKPEVLIRYRLTETQMATLTNYAKEFRVRFSNRDRHDHAAAAAMRVIDHKLIAARVPNGIGITDVGGNPLHYISKGKGGVHICGDLCDRKDAMRNVLRTHAARVKSRSDDLRVANLAKDYLNREPSFVCGTRAQDCNFQSQYLTSVHVYDIPLRDWPQIMENKGAAVVDGCMLHSEKIFSKVDGELPSVGARYEINTKTNRIKMGFVNSSSWWYEHSFSEYLLYGTDQLLRGENYAYSYKIIERRGDTIFFRIMRMPLHTVGVSSAVLRLPGAPMVRVRGMALHAGASETGLREKDYLFPRNLWYEMVAQASEDYERKALDYHRMYNHYRTMSVKSTINSITVMGGESVAADELVPLIVHACLSATMSSMLGRLETQIMTDGALASRDSLVEGLVDKACGIFSAMFKFAGSVILEGFTKLIPSFKSASFRRWIVTWDPQPTHEVISLKDIMVAAYGKDLLLPYEVVEGAARESEPYTVFEQTARNDKLAALRERFIGCYSGERSDGGVGESDEDADSLDGDCVFSDALEENDTMPSDTLVESEETCDQKLAVVSAQEGKLPDEVSEDVKAERIEAIKEHIAEIEMMNRALVSNARAAYLRVCVGGSPSAAQLRKLAETYGNPDLWEVVNGVIVSSARGQRVEEFQYAVVYHPNFMRQNVTFKAVREEKFDPGDGNPTKIHHVIDDQRFSGWVLTTDGMIIFNGPDILASMKLSLDLSHDYHVHLEKGPPGCGKTYSIIHAFDKRNDAIMCPVRESIEDTRERVTEMYPDIRNPKAVIRTLDSYLTNYRVGKTSSLKFSRLLADECFMAHAGKIYAVAALLGVLEVRAYGDDEQIPHIPRVQASKLHVKLRAQSSSDVWLTRRCPATAVAAWGSVYDWRVRVANDREGEIAMTHSVKGLEVPDDCVMMCMYQADKMVLRKMYAHCLDRIKIMTAHESEGKTFRHVRLHRFDVRRRNDKSNLFDQQPHVLVSMSRHTHTFVYYCPVDLSDLPSKWIKRALDPRRLAAVRDAGSAGEPMQFA